MTAVALEKMRPSSMARVIACPGSRRLAAIAGPKPSSSYADEGTAAHAVVERCLREGLAPFEMLGERIEVNGKDHVVNRDMVKATSHYVDRVWADRRRAPDTITLIEQRVTIDDIENGGTADCILISRSLNRVTIHDYKHGKGVYVSETWNAQFLCYAIGVITTVWPAHPQGFDTSVTVEMVCHQPRYEGARPVRSQVLPGGEVQRWRFGTLIPAIRASEKPDAPLKAGDHCTFCPAKDICSTYLSSPTKPHRGFQRQGFTVDAVNPIDSYGF
jgi:CRISPR/Cas system-associated exonuclease Cas4 (RecB family)